MRNYYGVYGKNGGGIYTDWSKVEKSKPYIDGFKVKKFGSFKDAELFVCNGLCTDYNVLEGLYNASLTAKGMNYFMHLEAIKNWLPEEEMEDENDRSYREWLNQMAYEDERNRKELLSQMTEEEIQEMRAIEEYQAAERAYLVFEAKKALS